MRTCLVQFTVLITIHGGYFTRPCIGEEGIARLSVNTLELAGGFTVIFPVLLAHALLPSHCFPRFTQSLVHKRSGDDDVVVVLAKPCTGHPLYRKYCFLIQELLFLTLAKQSFIRTSDDTR